MKRKKREAVHKQVGHKSVGWMNMSGNANAQREVQACRMTQKRSQASHASRQDTKSVK
jgi:hypothetical protein